MSYQETKVTTTKAYQKLKDASVTVTIGGETYVNTAYLRVAAMDGYQKTNIAPQSPEALIGPADVVIGQNKLYLHSRVDAYVKAAMPKKKGKGKGKRPYKVNNKAIRTLSERITALEERVAALEPQQQSKLRLFK